MDPWEKFYPIATMPSMNVFRFQTTQIVNCTGDVVKKVQIIYRGWQLYFQSSLRSTLQLLQVQEIK